MDREKIEDVIEAMGYEPIQQSLLTLIEGILNQGKPVLLEIKPGVYREYDLKETEGLEGLIDVLVSNGTSGDRLLYAQDYLVLSPGFSKV